MILTTLGPFFNTFINFSPASKPLFVPNFDDEWRLSYVVSKLAKKNFTWHKESQMSTF